MAEIALLATLIPKLVTLLDGEVKLHRNIHKDLESIKRELECMKEFLMTADDAEEENMDNDVWLSQVREVSYESEDIVDEFMLHFFKDPHVITGSLYSCVHSVTSMIKNGRVHRDMASRMHEIKVKFEEVRQGNGRYRTENFKPAITKSAVARKWHNPQQDVLILSQDELVGTKLHEKNLIDMLLNVAGDYSSMNVISVFGMGGVGKTSLVKKVYDNAEVTNHFNGRVWITVSRIFEPDDVLRALIQSLCEEAMPPDAEEQGKMQSRQKVIKMIRNMSRIELQEYARKLLGKNINLIVFDDVWTISAWNSIQNVFLQTCQGSQVMITTRNKSTALAASRGNVNCIYELNPLSYDDSLNLFYTKVFGHPHSCPAHLDEVAKNILQRCAGLPLAIVAMAGVLISKDVTAQSDEWGRIDSNLEKELGGIHGVLSLSYSDLPYELKACFLYLSIFPEDHLIQKMRLIRLWIAEGFVETKDSMVQEEVAESYLSELISRSLIQVVERTGDGAVLTFQVHSLLREVITKKAMHQKFAAVNTHYHMYPKMRRLSFSNVLGIPQHSRGLAQLRSLFMFNLGRPVTKKSLFLKNSSFKLLTVLDLQGTILGRFPPDIVKLINLKYLNLSHTDVKEVPSSIGRLRKLETLDLRSTLVSELPKEILKLQCLRDLLAYRVHNKNIHGVRAPEGIQCLPSLENLCILDAEHVCSETKEQLAQLRRLGVKNLSNDNADATFSYIDDLRYLRVLSMSSSKNAQWAMDLKMLLSPSNSLRRLYVTGKLESLPRWLETMCNLVTIYLKSSCLQDDPLEILGQLPNLVHVELSKAYTGAEMLFRAGHFQKLRVLGLSKLLHLERILFENKATPNLERLSLKNNKLMKMFPTSIEYLCKLKELNFVDMSPELVTAIRGSNGIRDTFEHEKIKHVGKVNWVYKVENAWRRESLLVPITGKTEELTRETRKLKNLSTLNRAETQAQLHDDTFNSFSFSECDVWKIYAI